MNPMTRKLIAVLLALLPGAMCPPQAWTADDAAVEKAIDRGHAANKFAIILPWAMGASVSGVITSAIIAGIYVSLLR